MPELPGVPNLVVFELLSYNSSPYSSKVVEVFPKPFTTQTNLAFVPEPQAPLTLFQPYRSPLKSTW